MKKELERLLDHNFENYYLEQITYLDSLDKTNAEKVQYRNKEDDEWQNASYEYFLNSLQADWRILFRNFIHADTKNYKVKIIPSFWRVQGWLCLDDIIAYAQNLTKPPFISMMHVLYTLYEDIVFDKQEGYPITIVYNDKVYFRVLNIHNVLHRSL